MAAAFFLVLVFIVFLFGYLILWVIGPMTQPTPFFDRLMKSAEGNKDAAPRASIDMLMMMEYANADIRTTCVQIAFALVAGLVFAFIGGMLLIAGVTGALNLGYKNDKQEFNLVTATPGIACLVFAAVIIGLGVNRNVGRQFHGKYEKAGSVEYIGSGSQAKPAKAGGTEPAVSKAEAEAAQKKGGSVNSEP
jgi:hypothetical protein